MRPLVYVPRADWVILPHSLRWVSLAFATYSSIDLWLGLKSDLIKCYPFAYLLLQLWSVGSPSQSFAQCLSFSNRYQYKSIVMYNCLYGITNSIAESFYNLDQSFMIRMAFFPLFVVANCFCATKRFKSIWENALTPK